MAAKRKKTTKRPTRSKAASSATWQARETDISRLDEAQRATLLGYRADNNELNTLKELIWAAEQFCTSFSTPRFAAPASVDWRDKGGNWVSSVKNQLSCGSCVSFATIATVESRLKIVCKNPARNDDFSEAHLFFCGCGDCCSTGWNFAPALDFAKATGLAPESAWPYQPTNQPCNQSISPTYKITGWKRLLSKAERKESLATVGPAVGGMKVFADFFDYGSGVYRPTTNQVAGYHAVSVVGYDDTAGCWICKNSWGANWGEGGFFRIAFGTCDMDTTFPFYEVQLACPVEPDDSCRRYVPYLVRVLHVARYVPRFRQCLRYYVCRTGPRPYLCSRPYLAVARSVALVLQKCPQYRKPFCSAL